MVSDTWTRPYSREKAAFPAAWTRERKFWPAVGRIESAYGDRNLVCSCLPTDAYAEANAGGIGRSTDGGQSFQHVYAGLPAWKFTTDERTRSIYALVYEGRVIRSTDDGATWQPFAAAPPMTGISDIAVAADGRLVVSGYEGSWKTVR